MRLLTFKNQTKPNPTGVCIHTEGGKTCLTTRGDLCPRLTLAGRVPVQVEPYQVEKREGPEPGEKEEEDQQGEEGAWVEGKDALASSMSGSPQPKQPAPSPPPLLSSPFLVPGTHKGRGPASPLFLAPLSLGPHACPTPTPLQSLLPMISKRSTWWQAPITSSHCF